MIVDPVIRPLVVIITAASAFFCCCATSKPGANLFDYDASKSKGLFHPSRREISLAQAMAFPAR